MGAVVLIASVTGVAYFLEDRYAKADDLKYNYQQDRVRDLKSNIRWYQDQMSWIMNRCGKQDPRIFRYTRLIRMRATVIRRRYWTRN